MASPHHVITFFFLIFPNLLLLEASSPGHDHDFLHCLIDRFQNSNSTTDIIYTPQDATYASLLQAQNLRLSPAASSNTPDFIVTPFHVSEIQASVYCCRKSGLQIRVRSGGHDYEGLSYTSRLPSVVVDLRNFRSVTIDGESKTAWVHAGATLGELYYAISQKSKTLAFPAGSCPTVGVGGHFSGGGYSMMSRKHSIAADHIIDARLINADGEVLDREAMGEDLFWAIRGGGGSSFGIVLEFKVALVSVPEIVTVFNKTRTLEENATELVHKWQHIADKVDESLLIRIFLNVDTSPATGGRTISASFASLYLGRAHDLMPIMNDQFPELGLTLQDCREMSWIESVLYFAYLENDLAALLDTTPRGGFDSFYFKGKSDFVSAPIPAEGLTEIWRHLLEEEGSALQWSPYGGALNRFSESEPHRRGNVFMIEYSLFWMRSDDTEARMDWMRRLYSFMGRYATESPRAAYVNYRDLDIGRNNEEGDTSYEEASVWGFRYFKSNFRRLVAVKTKFDPSNFFRNEQSIPPLPQFKNLLSQ